MKPTKGFSEILLMTEVFMGAVILLYFAAFPTFPEIPSVDFFQHISISRDLAHGIIPPLTGQLLYYGVEWYLAIFQFFFPHANPFMLTRWAMAILVFISPLVVYLACKEIFQNKRTAEITALVYAISGSIWMEMVFVSGLYANFYGVLSSLLLVAAALRFSSNKPTVRNYIMLGLALVNALFSHYSTLLVFPPLMGYLAWKRSWRTLEVLASPTIGAFFFPNYIASLTGFLAPTQNITVQPTFLSSFLPIPSLSFLAQELTDYEFVFLGLIVLAFAWMAYKMRDGRMAFVLAWFFLVILVSPFNTSAWRFAFIALVPGTLMTGWCLSRLSRFKPNFVPRPRNLLFLFLLITPVFYPSWSYSALSHSLVPQEQQGTYDALQWIGHNLPVNPVCHNEPDAVGRCYHIVSVNDWRLTYSPLFNGSQVIYAPDYNVVFTDPLQVQLLASREQSIYIAVVQNGTIQASPCDQRFRLGLSETINGTNLGVNQSARLDISAIRGVNTTVAIYDDGSNAGQTQLVDGKGSVDVSWGQAGNDTIQVGIGSILTNPIHVSVGPDPTVSTPSSASVPTDFCQPYEAYNPSTMSGWTVIYEREGVRIYKVAV